MGDIVQKLGSKIQNFQEFAVHRRLSIKQWNVDYFFKIIDELDDFLEYDRCHILADNYLIVMVFMYFLRASYIREEYTLFNFYVALHLAHDMEEDDEDLRSEIVEWSSPDHGSTWIQSELMYHRDELFKRIGYRAVVSRHCCDALMRIMRPNHSVWQRKRHAAHAGARPRFSRIPTMCPNCIGDRSRDSL